MQQVQEKDFEAFGGTGEKGFLQGVADLYSVESFDSDKAVERFMEMFVAEIGQDVPPVDGALELVAECKRRGLKVIPQKNKKMHR